MNGQLNLIRRIQSLAHSGGISPVGESYLFHLKTMQSGDSYIQLPVDKAEDFQFKHQANLPIEITELEIGDKEDHC